MNLRKKAKIGKLVYYYSSYEDYNSNINLKSGIIKKIEECIEYFRCKKECCVLIGIDNQKPRCFYYDDRLVIKSISKDFIDVKEFII